MSKTRTKDLMIREIEMASPEKLLSEESLKEKQNSTTEEMTENPSASTVDLDSRYVVLVLVVWRLRNCCCWGSFSQYFWDYLGFEDDLMAMGDECLGRRDSGKH